MINIIILILLLIKNKVTRILGCFISIISIIISGIGIYYLSMTNFFFERAFSKKKVVTTTYYIITKAENPYEEYDIDKDIYYYQNIDINPVKDYLKERYQLEYIEEKLLKDLLIDIKDGHKKFMVIDKSTYSMVLEVDQDLKHEDYKIVYQFDISKTEKQEIKNKKDKFTLLILGTDFANLNDLNLLVTVNLKTNKALVTTIPRAYYIEVCGRNGRKDTLSFMAPYGVETSICSMENYFNIEIDYYLKINTHSLVALVDAIGGITYCSDQAYYTSHSLVLDTYIDNKGKFYVQKGCQPLNGIQTLTVARERKAFYDADRTRQKNCVKIMQAIIDKMVSTNTLTNYESILNSLVDLYETDISKEEFSLISKYVMNHPKGITLTMQSVDGYETRDYVHLTDLKDYVIIPYEETVKTAVQEINKVLGKNE